MKKYLKRMVASACFRLQGAWCALTYKNYIVIAYTKPQDVVMRYEFPVSYLKYLFERIPASLNDANEQQQMDQTLREFKHLFNDKARPF